VGDIAFGQRKKSTGIRLGLLPLSHWTYGRGAETRMHIAALVNTVDYTDCDMVKIPRRWSYRPGQIA